MKMKTEFRYKNNLQLYSVFKYFLRDWDLLRVLLLKTIY